MNTFITKSPLKILITEDLAQQRIDNFLIKQLKGVPHSHIYAILRKGEVRVNSCRKQALYKLQVGDEVRIPPIRMSEKKSVSPKITTSLEEYILFEDTALLVLNKPSGIAVHGGSGISLGVIEQLRYERPQAKFLELVHRLDRGTSGILLVAKKRQALIGLQKAMQEMAIHKYYIMMVTGLWKEPKRVVKTYLRKKVLPNGEKHVYVGSSNENAQLAITQFFLEENYETMSLLSAKLETGRTHQLRVQLTHLGFPIIGDDKYGDFSLNKQTKNLKRIFLHASKIIFLHPLTQENISLSAPLPQELETFLSTVKSCHQNKKNP